MEMQHDGRLLLECSERCSKCSSYEISDKKKIYVTKWLFLDRDMIFAIPLIFLK